MVFSCDKFGSYIVGSKVIVHTDHVAIKYLMKRKMLNLDSLGGFFCYKNLICISLIGKEQRTPYLITCLDLKIRFGFKGIWMLK